VRIANYIEDNPVTAGLATAPEQFPWSSAWPIAQSAAEYHPAHSTAHSRKPSAACWGTGGSGRPAVWRAKLAFHRLKSLCRAGLETRRRRGRPPHMVFITIGGPQDAILPHSIFYSFFTA
jgi:hypothetical protein